MVYEFPMIVFPTWMSSDLCFRGFRSFMRNLLLVLSSLETKKARRQTSSFLFYQIFSGGSSQKQTKITTILPPRKIPVAMDFHRSSAWKAMILSINRYPIANKILWGILKCFGKSFMNRTRRPTIIIGPTISISQNKGSSMRTSNPRTTGIKADGIRKHAKKLNITLLKNFLFIVLLFLFIYGVNNIFFL